MVQTQIAAFKEAAQQRDKVPEIWISGFGPTERITTPLTETQKADIYRIVFEESEGKFTGLVPWENPIITLKGTIAENVVREWFTQRIN